MRIPESGGPDAAAQPMEAGLGTILRMDAARRREPRSDRPAGEAEIVLFTGIRYDREAAGQGGHEQGGRGPGGARPGRKRG